LNLLDIIILIFIAIGFILGFKDGFVRKIIGFLLLNVFNQPGTKISSKSFFHEKIMGLIPSVISTLRVYTPETKKMIKGYINDKDKEKDTLQ